MSIEVIKTFLVLNEKSSTILIFFLDGRYSILRGNEI